MIKWEKIKHGDRVRVKHTPETRKYGLPCSAGFEHESDNRVFAGEIGELLISTNSNHECMSRDYYAYFDRGRRIKLGSVWVFEVTSWQQEATPPEVYWDEDLADNLIKIS